MDQIFQNIPTEDRAIHLESNADKIIENYHYSRPLTADEIGAMYQEHSENAVALDRLRERLKTITDEYKEQMKPLQEANALIVTELKTKRRQEIGTVYEMIDHESRVVVMYDSQGNKVSERPAFGNELQRTIFASMRRAENE